VADKRQVGATDCTMAYKPPTLCLLKGTLTPATRSGLRGVAYPAHVERHRTRARCDHSNAYKMRNPSKKAPTHSAAVVVPPVRGHVPPQPVEASSAWHPRHGAAQLAAC